MTNSLEELASRYLAPTPAGPSASRHYALLPSRQHPRWILPIDSPAYAEVAAELVQPYRAKAAIAAKGLRIAARMGLLRAHPYRKRTDGPPALEMDIARLLGEAELRLAVHIGRDQAQPSTLTVAAVNSRTVVGFGRIAVRESGRERLAREATALESAQALGIPAPSLVHYGTMSLGNGEAVPIVVQRAIPGRASKPEWTDGHEDLLGRFIHGQPRCVATSALVHDLHARLRAEKKLSLYVEALDRAVEALGDWRHEPVLNHRDFAPWNLVENEPASPDLTPARPRLAVIDWEFAEPDGLPYLDAFYFHLAVGVLIGGWGPSDLAEYAMQWLSTIDLPTDLARALLSVLLIERISWRLEQGAELEEDVIARGCNLALRRLNSGEVGSRTRRPRILMSAYACEPNRGSEPGQGWNWALQASKDHELYVITRSNNRTVIEDQLESHPIPNIRFIYHDLPGWTRWLKQRTGMAGTQAYYVAWQATALRAARRAHKKIGFDLVHHVTFNSFDVPGFLWLMPLPFVWGPVGSGQVSPPTFSRYFGWRDRPGERFRTLRKRLVSLNPLVRVAARRARVLMAANSDTAERLRRIPGAREPLMELDAGVAFPCTCAPSSRPNEGPLRILWAGGLIARKAPLLAIEVSDALRARGVAHTLQIVGDGPLRTQITYETTQRNLADCVHIAGGLPFAAMHEAYSHADVFLFTSLQDTSGNVLLEAMAHGLPVVTLNHQGAADIVAAGCGLKVEVTTPEEVVERMATALRDLATRPALRLELGAAARRHVETHHAWGRKQGVLRRVYESALSETKQ